MTAFLIQALLWLLVAFLLGLGIGRLLKSLFCRAEVEPIYSGGMAVPKPGVGRGDTPRTGVSATTAAVAGTAATAGAVAVARKQLAEAELPDVSLKVPEVKLPEVSVKPPEVDLPDLPEVSLKAPEVDLPEVSVKSPEVDLPEVSVKTPEVDLPDLPEVTLEAPAVDLPGVTLTAPQVEAGLPDMEIHKPAIDFSLIDPHKPIVDPPDFNLELPEVSLSVPQLYEELPAVSMQATETVAEETVTEEGSNWLDIATGTVVAAGAGLAAKAASALDFSGIDPHKPIVDPSDVDVALPEVTMAAPQMDVSLPEVSLSALETDISLPELAGQKPAIDFSLIDPHKPIVDPPDFNLELPEVSLSVPQLYEELPAISMQATETVAEETVTEEGSNWLGIATGTVVAAGAGLAAKAASALDFSGIDPHKPIVDPPDLDVALPEVTMAAPQVDVSLQEVSLAAPEVDLPALPEVTLAVPQVDVDLPEMEVQVSEVSLSALETDISLPELAGQKPAIDFSLIDPHKPIVDPPDFNLELPEVSLSVPQLYEELPAVSIQATETVAEETVTEEGSNWLDIATGTVAATGAGLATTVASASDTVQDTVAAVTGQVQEAVGLADNIDADADEVESDDETDWLLLIVQRVKEEYQGLNPRAVSKLWDMESGYDCSALERYESLTLEPAHYDKLGSIHCGVTRAGFVAVGGDVSDIGQGTAILFHYPNIVVCRDTDDNHHFIRVTS